MPEFSDTKLIHFVSVIYIIIDQKEIFIKKFYHPMKKGVGVERFSRRKIMCATAALCDNASNWGGKGGCLGFFEFSFSLGDDIHS
jgi:hypothetical protein